MLDMTNFQKEKSYKREYQNQRPSYSCTQKFNKNTKQEDIK